MLGYSDTELADKGCYDLVHYDDLAYVASAHQERKYLKAYITAAIMFPTKCLFYKLV